ncbi:MAG: hypothetical protein P9M08_13145 [Candidatus Erginobacter occultus]|nr:hypothetical protein [Candidatus Erginobacter occultus]
MKTMSSYIVGLMTAAVIMTVAVAPFPAVAGTPDTGYRIEVRGLRIVGDGYGDDMSMRPFNWTYGTTIVLLVNSEAGSLIDFDDDESTITLGRDNQETDLLKSSGKSMNGKPDFGAFPSISEDRKACLIEVKLPRNPAPGASTLECAGALVFASATEKESFTVQDAVLKEGTEMTAGQYSLTITEAGTPRYGGDEYPLAVTFRSGKKFDTLEGVVFLDEQGEEIESTTGGSSETRFLGTVTATRTYKLAKKVEKATIVFTCWKDWKKVPVPFSVTVTLGLSE